MHEAYRTNARKSLLLSVELFRVLDSLAAGGVRVIPFKGPALASLAYDDPGLRAFSDLDLLVERGDFTAARTILLSLGYASPVPEGLPDGFLDWNEELPLLNARVGIRVDLHWRPLPAHFSTLGPGFFFERTRPVVIDGRPVPTFSPEATFLYLCAHGGKHAWSSLKWLADAAHLVHRRQLDWTLILAETEARRLDGWVLLTLALLKDLLGVECPVPSGGVVPRTGAYRIARRNLTTVTRESNRFREFRFQMRLVMPLRDKRRLAFSMLAPSPLDAAKIRLPNSISGLYYPLRLARLACEQPGRLLAALCRSHSKGSNGANTKNPA